MNYDGIEIKKIPAGMSGIDKRGKAREGGPIKTKAYEPTWPHIHCRDQRSFRTYVSLKPETHFDLRLNGE